MRTTAYDQRWVDVVTYECKHSYWQEKGLNLSEGICDSCLQSYLAIDYDNNWFARLIWKIWNNKRVRRFIRE
jgi:hypothetical protein